MPWIFLTCREIFQSDIANCSTLVFLDKNGLKKKIYILIV